MSDGDDRHVAATSRDKKFNVGWVAGKNDRFLAKRDRHHHGVNDIYSSGFAEQPSCFVRLAFAKRNDRAPR